jgi:hypothetical protein
LTLILKAAATRWPDGDAARVRRLHCSIGPMCGEGPETDGRAPKGKTLFGASQFLRSPE